MTCRSKGYCRAQLQEIPWDFLKHFSSPLTSLKWSTGSLWKKKKSRVWYMPWNAQAPEEHCHLLYLFAQWLWCLQEVYYSYCTFRKITPQISEAGKTLFWWHLSFLGVITGILMWYVCVCVSNIPQSVGNVYGCERIFPRARGRAVISVFHVP